jgi:hypothetical protein
MTRIAAFSTALLAAAVFGASGPALDDAAWQAAYGKLQAAKVPNKRSKDPKAFVDAILELGSCTYAKRDQQTATELVTILIQELNDDSPDGSKEIKIDGLVIEACETSLKKITNEKAVDYLVGMAKNAKGLKVRVRFSLCRVIGSFKGEAVKVLVDLADDKDTRLQIGAVDGLKEYLKSELSKKVDDLRTQVASGADQAKQVLESAGKALEEQPAALFKARLEAMPTQLDGVLTGFTTAEPLQAALKEVRAIVEGIANDDAKRKVQPIVEGFAEFVDKFVASVEELNAVRKTAEPATTLLLKILTDPKRSWEVQIGALQALRADCNAAHADAMIECLTVSGQADGRLKVDVMQALASILGIKEAKTDDANWWKGALTERRSGKRPGEGGGTTVTPTEFFGLKTKSTRIVFILDRTGSMDFKCTADLPKRNPEPPPKSRDTATGDEKVPPQEEGAKKKAAEIKKKWDDRKIEKRMDALKREFINTIYNLDPRVMFSVVLYEGNSQNWKPVLVQANWPNKMDCINDIDRLSASGGTNIWEGLETAYRFVAEPARPDVIQFDKKGNYVTTVNGADTFFLMTDGNHNNGKFSINVPPAGDFDERAFLSEFKKINMVRKVVVNTIILGDTTLDEKNNPDPIKQKSLSLFRTIADISGGSFVHLGK